MSKQLDSQGNRVAVGDTVEYYNYTNARDELGTITRVDCRVVWVDHVIGVEINGGITRPYNDVRRVAESIQANQ